MFSKDFVVIIAPLSESNIRRPLIPRLLAISLLVSHLASASAFTDSTRSWFDPAKQYIKFKIGNDGVYRVAYEQLQSFLPQNADPRKLDLFYKGKAIPFVFVGDSNATFTAGEYIEFYGSRNYDSPNVLNEYSDTSAYFLDFDGTGSLRARKDTALIVPNVTTSSILQKVHLERDSIYYFGDGGLPANNNSDKVAGEGWYWKRLFANQSVAISYTSTNLYNTGNPQYTVRGKFHSPVIQQATPNHSIDILVNGSNVGQIQFRGYSDTTFSLAVSSALFNEGVNTIGLRSNVTSAAVNEILVDWLEIEFLKSLRADGDSLIFSAGQLPVGQVGRFQIAGFTGSSIVCYRIDINGGIDRLFSGMVSGTPGDYTFEFTDTIAAQRTYYALSASKVKSVAGFEAKQFLDIRSASYGADYLIVTGKALAPAANRLSAYRFSRGIGRTKVVQVEDIYDEFSFGMFDPFALRRFLLAADTLWIPPRPQYVVLFGDANWDYKDIYQTGKLNIVPSLGNPVSDAWLVASRTDVFLPMKKVGRVPVRNLSQANAFVDMIMAYESTPINLMNKRFMFMAAGLDSSETARFQQFSESLVSQYIASSPIGGSPLRIYKTLQQIVDITKTEEVKRILDEGAGWINYFGHAGTDLWGNGITSADQLVNAENRRHLVTDISCSTARFGEPLTDSFGEKLVLAQSGGAIGFIGSSGFGFESPLRVLASRMFRAFAKDSVRELGALVLSAKDSLWRLGTSSILNQQALQQWTLLGDPATRLAVPLKPDLAVEAGSIVISPSLPNESDENVSVSVPVLNYGLLYADSTNIRFTHSLSGDPDVIIDRKVKPIVYSDTLPVASEIFRRAGLHRITVTIDPDRKINEAATTNNSASFTFFVASGGSVITSPLNSSAVKPDSVFLTVQNPSLSPGIDWKATFEIDTASGFDSQARIRQMGVALGNVVTTFQVSPGLLQNGKLYFWRSRFSASVDSTPWTVGRFITQANPTTWIQDRPALFQTNTLDGVSVASGAQLLKQNLAVELFSAGFDDGLDAKIFIDGVNISQGFSGRGYNIAVLNEFSGKLEAFASFSLYTDIPDTSKAEPAIQFLEAVPMGRRVLVVVLDEGQRNKTERLNTALESIGSALIRSLGFRSSWAISGWKGAPIGSVPEALSSAGSGPVTIRDTIHTEAIRGSLVTGWIGPALKWNSISASIDTGNGKGRINFEAIRRKRGGGQDTVALTTLDVDTVRAVLNSSVESIQLKAHLLRNPNELSPELARWSVSYQPPAELAINNRTVRVLKDSVLEGDPVSLEANIFNVGYAPSESVTVSLGIFSQNVVIPFYQTVIPPIPVGGSATVASSFPTAGKSGRMVFFVQVDPERKSLELATSNNALSVPFTVLRDSIAPSLDITFDGQRIFDGDYVSSVPTITVIIYDNSPLPITSANDVNVQIDGRRISLGTMPDSLFETRPGPEKAVVTIRPQLSKGEHVISVQTRDATGNLSDTTSAQIRFKVETESKLLNVFNYPNPFSSETRFTFNLVGARIPDEMTIKVYTVAGRLVREIKVTAAELRFGFNSILWDGRDQDGGELANGVYFYKIVMHVEDHAEEVVQKMARIR